MKGNNYLLIAAIAMLGIVLSCKKDPKTGPEDGNPIGFDEIPLKEAQVVLPDGSNYELSGAELLVLGSPFRWERVAP